MLSTSRRDGARRGTRVSAIVASAAVVVTLVPALLLSSPSTAASARAAAPAAPSASPWTASNRTPQAQLNGHKRRVNPSAFRAYTLNAAQMRAALADAPREGTRGVPATVRIPAPNGQLVSFEVVSSPIMQSRLAAAHPDIQTYAGRSADGRASVRLDMTPMGFHAYVRGAHGGDSWYVDPAYNGDTSLYLSYLGADAEEPAGGFQEGAIEAQAAEDAPVHTGEAPGDLTRLRTYRLALVTDPGYATYFGGQAVNDGNHDPESNAIVLAEKVTLMNRVNEVYNDDLAVRLELIDDTDKLNLNTAAMATLPNGPCGAAACFSTANVTQCSSLGIIRIVLGQLVGADSYDLGHLALGAPGGGVAGLGVVGGNNKAQGCTGIPTPEGDYYAVDYVAHEMGHQFGGNHTFNGNQYNCSGGNRNGGTSVEPGSGTSVMAYAGICQQDNLQPHSDPYFSQRSQSEITANIVATKANVNEVQTVSLYGFDGADAITLTFKNQTTAPIPAGSTSAQIDAALETLPAIGPGGVTVSGYNNQNNATGLANGIQVTFGGPGLLGADQPRMTVTPVAGDVTGFVGTTAQGGPQTNGGHTVEDTDNHNPTVTAPDDKTIPMLTPFTLTGSGTDADDDSLIYLWEQNDRGGSSGNQLVSQTKTNGPLFRVFGTYADVTPAGTVTIHSPGENHATGDPSRTFPDMQQILDSNYNAATPTPPVSPATTWFGRCPDAPPPPVPFPPATGTGITNVPVATVECFAEWLPDSSYVGDVLAANNEPSLHFRLTARDQHAEGGGYAFDDVKLTIDKTAGPLLVQGRNTAATAAVGGREENITWTVNSTDKPTLAPNVRISVSTDGGLTWPYVVADNVPNDGAQRITWPNVGTDRARLKIEAVDNYFFDVNNLDFAINPRLVATGPAASSYSVQYSDGPTTPITVSAETGRRDGPGLSASASGLPAGLNVTETDTSGATGPLTSTFTVSGHATDAPGTYPVTVTVTDGTDSEELDLTIEVTAEDATATYTGPATVEAPVGGNDVVTVPLSAHVTQAADGSPGDLTKATVTIKDTIANEVLCADAAVDANGDASCSYSADIPLQSGRVYNLQLQVGGRYAGSGTGSLSVTIDHTDPQTSITSGPAEGSLLLDTATSIGIGADESPVTFTCTLDGATQACPTSPVSLSGLSARTHTFSVFATDPAGNADETPATRSFTVPLDDVALASTKGSWKRAGQAGAFGGTVSTSKKKGSTLSTTISGATSLSLIATTGKKGGTVKVFLNGQLLKAISLKGAAAGKVVIPVATFASAQSGTVTIVNDTKKAKKKKKQKTVVIDGLGVVTAS
ncbi:reprolysin-like metallopeptidase [Nocardioides halotolerans]|uniref:reprolysin-like metallopeptidase n=1 Tax=Nocardioides halotolerans TaxID=433660 RepID=UPI0003FCCCC5|nr:M12 family metallo-peptidase [Nocardioides halotolerans]